MWSDALGLIGKADVVEFEPDGRPYPVEYKHGSRHKAADIAAWQLDFTWRHHPDHVDSHMVPLVEHVLAPLWRRR